MSLRSLIVAAATATALGGAEAQGRRAGFVPLDDVTVIPAALRAPIALALVNVTVDTAVREIATRANVGFTFDGSLPGLSRRVTLRAERITAADGLKRVLEGSELRALVSDEGQIVLVRRRAESANPLVEGTLVERGGVVPVTSAYIELVGTRFTAVSRDGGHFSIGRVPPGNYRARVIRIGYAPGLAAVSVTASDSVVRIDLTLERVAVPLSAVVVTPGYFGLMRSPLAAAQTLSRQQIETQPQIGEDLFRAVNRLPGLSATDMSARFYVRGGYADEMYATLDGLELDEPYHLKDIDAALSIIDVSAISGVELTTGGFSAEYGNRLTGVFKMSSLDPTTERSRTTLGLSFLNARGLSQGRFAGDRGGWLVSARRGYIDLALKLTAMGDSLSPTYYDVFAKTQYDLRRGGRVAAHVLHAGDHLNYDDYPNDHINSRYFTTYGWLTWDANVGERVRQQSVVSVGRLTWARDGDSFEGTRQIMALRDRRSYDVAAVRQDWTVDLSKRLMLKAGWEAKAGSADYDYLTWVRRTPVVDYKFVTRFDTLSADLTPDGTSAGVYVSQRAQLLPSLTAELGARYDHTSHTGDDIASPRLNVAWQPLRGTALRAAWGRYAQPRALYGLDATDGVTEFEPAERAEQRGVSVEQQITPTVTARVEGYDRRLSNVRPRSINTRNILEMFPEISSDRIRITPSSARARGVEVYLKRAGGDRVDWSAIYTLASVSDRIGGRDVPRLIDHRHTAYVDWAFRPRSNKWRLSAGWLWHSGSPATPAVFRLDTLHNANGTTGIHVETLAGDLDSERLPQYRRVDFRFTRYFDTRGGRIAVYADVFNAFNRSNPRGYNYSIDFPSNRVRTTKSYESQIPRLPSLGVSWSF